MAPLPLLRAETEPPLLVVTVVVLEVEPPQCVHVRHWHWHSVYDAAVPL